jgi:lysophospholipase L1-like esterase
VDRRQFLASAAALAAGARAAASPDAPPAARGPAAPAAANASSEVAGNVVWQDVREWGVEGRGFSDTTGYFDRLPGRAKGVVRDAVWNLSRHTSGMAAFFETDAVELYVRYTLLNSELAMPHMPATGVSGVDLYGMTDRGWRWVITHLPKTRSVEAKLIDGLAAGRRAYHLNLPLYNGVTSLAVGVPRDASFVPVPPRTIKPVLFYGTSITQGACASRPGMSFTSILGRRLNRPVLNFGFSGNGKTELEVARFLGELDPIVFVIDTSANTPAEHLRNRMEAIVRLLREKHPTTPVLLVDERQWDNAPLVPAQATNHNQKTDALRQAYDNLIAAGVPHLHFRTGDDLLGSDNEATVDGSHPSDLGMERYARSLEPDLRRIIGST